MQIVFRFNGSEELVVSTTPGGVMIERLDRNEPGQGVQSGAVDIYTVKSGDSLSKIAQDKYGDASRWTLIYDANRHIQNPDHIQVGWELRIPAAPTAHQTYWESRTRETTPAMFVLSKSQARSIASAMMQAASEA